MFVSFKSNTMDVTANSFGTPELTPGFREILVAQSFVFLFPFLYVHCIIRPLRLLITPLISSNFSYLWLPLIELSFYKLHCITEL
jgi:hypothetical protein